MHRSRVALALAVALLAATAGLAQDVLRSRFEFDGRKNFVGVSGEPASFDARFHVDLYSVNLTDPGVTGWSWSAAAGGGVTITAVTDQGTFAADVGDTPPGARDGGFSLHELATGSTSRFECEGSSGAVGAVVLSFEQEITLPPLPFVRRWRLATLDATVAALTPADGSRQPIGELWFVDGCAGSGDPVINRVLAGGLTLAPELDRYEVRLEGGLEDCVARRSGGPSLELRFEGARITGDPSSGCPQNPAVIELRDRPAGDLASTDVFIRMVSRGLENGVQGWTLSLAVCSGEVDITEASTDETAAASIDDEPPGLRDHGFSVAQTTHRLSFDGSACFGMRGVVQATVLSFVMPVTLGTDSDHRVLKLRVETTIPLPPPVDDVTPGEVWGQIEFKDDCQGSGAPYDNTATVRAETTGFDFLQALRLRFASRPPSADRPFLRCDPNDDGRVDLADAVWIINDLFRGGPETGCEASVDCDESGLGSLTDALYAVRFFFGLGSPIPGGGVCENAPPERCELPSGGCS